MSLSFVHPYRALAMFAPAFLAAGFLQCVPNAATAAGGVPTPCEKDFSARDAAGILMGSAALNRYSMSAALGEKENGCEMGDQNALIDFSIRTKPQLAAGGNKQLYETMARDNRGTPYSGVGDQAAWFDVRDSNIPGMKLFETISLKGDMMCIVDLHFANGPQGEKAITPARGEQLARKLGALCNKSFAAHRG